VILESGIGDGGTMSGTWSDNKGSSGSFYAERGVVVGAAMVDMPATDDVLITIEEGGGIGSAIYYGSYEEDDSEIILKTCEIEMELETCIVTMDDHGRVVNVTNGDMDLSFTYNADGSFNYQMILDGVLFHSGSNIGHSQQSEQKTIIGSNPAKKNFRLVSERPPLIQAENNETASADVFRQHAFSQMTKAVANLNGSSVEEISDKFLWHLWKNTPVGELSLISNTLSLINAERTVTGSTNANDPNNLCRGYIDSNKYEECRFKVFKINDFLTNYINLQIQVAFEIIKEELKNYSTSEDNCFDGVDNDWDDDTDCDDTDCTIICILDEDKDGIPSDQDNCMNMYNPTQDDDDNDYVGNACDECPNTPPGVKVNNNGCTTCPKILGDYKGTYRSVYANCDDPEDQDIDLWEPPVEISIDYQSECNFTGTLRAEFTAEIIIDGKKETVTVYDNTTLINATINSDGEILGDSSYELQEHIGQGTFIGELTNDALSITISGHDSLGCDYVKWVTANPK